MSTKKDSQYQIKKVKFGGNELTLYSLDGHTWSSRKEELVLIQERHENGRVTFNDSFRENKDGAKGKEGQRPRFVPKRQNQVEEDLPDDEILEADPYEKEVVDVDIEDVSGSDEEVPRGKGKEKGSSRLPSKPEKVKIASKGNEKTVVKSKSSSPVVKAEPSPKKEKGKTLPPKKKIAAKPEKTSSPKSAGNKSKPPAKKTEAKKPAGKSPQKSSKKKAA